MKHKHHIIPKHAGGTDDPSNLIELSVDEHAEAHRKLYEEHGRWQDYLAWQGLAKLKSKEELVRLRQQEAARLRLQLYPNPFEGIRTETNFAINKCHQKKATTLANSEDAIKKKKKTFSEIKHQQKENNSQFGKIWCVSKNASDLSSRKKFNKEEIPENWISTTEWKQSRKNKNSHAFGKHWYNDKIKNYYLNPTDAKIVQLNLNKGRLMNK